MRFSKYIASFLLIAGLFACHSPAEQPQKAPAKTKNKEVKKKKAKKKKEARKYPLITNKNVVSFFTQYGKNNPETMLRLTCKFGTIDIKLYTNTPLHRADMVYLTKAGYFNSTQFYRVSKDFVDQAGNSDDWETQEIRVKIGSYTLPAEMNNNNFHKYGSVAMARRYDKNPKKRSSPFEFYITLGRKYSKAEMEGFEEELGIKYTPEQIKAYTTIGGNPFLDKQHTVIGEVISGMDVAQEINKVAVDRSEWPLTEIAIKMEVLR